MRPGPEGRWKWLALDPKLPVSQRLIALNSIERPAVTFLNKLLKPTTPRQLLFRATELYDLALARKKLLAESMEENED